MENPGIYSARFFGENISDEEKCKKVLEMLKDAKESQRTARFKCSICFIDEQGKEHIFEQKCEGKIAHTLEGSNGFGYDPIFEYNGKTYAQMDKEEKNKISHRGKAIEEFINYIANSHLGPVLF